MTARRDSEDVQAVLDIIEFSDDDGLVRAARFEITAEFERLTAELSRLSDLVSGGNCIRGENGESPCETLAAELLRLRERQEKNELGDEQSSSCEGSGGEPHVSRAKKAGDKITCLKCKGESSGRFTT